MAQQIQALIANVQELMKQNEELKRRARLEGSNASLHRRSRSRHDEEASSPANSKGKDATEYTGESIPGNDKFYDGTKDPLDHIGAFKTILNLQQTPDEVICRSFLATLRGAARVWFSKLPESSIENFEQLSDSFVRHFIGRQRHKRPTSYLLTIRQQEGESLRDYVKRFNKAVLEIDKADDQVIMMTFQAGLE
nr:hypothetical protein CFP56_46518 [Quercus suber]